MKCAEQNHERVFLTEDDLLQLQLQIAQRADELAQSRMLPHDYDCDRQCWLEAERDVLDRCHRAPLAVA